MVRKAGISGKYINPKWPNFVSLVKDLRRALYINVIYFRKFSSNWSSLLNYEKGNINIPEILGFGFVVNSGVCKAF